MAPTDRMASKNESDETGIYHGLNQHFLELLRKTAKIRTVFNESPDRDLNPSVPLHKDELLCNWPLSSVIGQIW